jgi:hypothetical protein
VGWKTNQNTKYKSLLYFTILFILRWIFIYFFPLSLKGEYVWAYCLWLLGSNAIHSHIIFLCWPPDHQRVYMCIKSLYLIAVAYLKWKVQPALQTSCASNEPHLMECARHGFIVCWGSYGLGYKCVLLRLLYWKLLASNSVIRGHSQINWLKNWISWLFKDDMKPGIQFVLTLSNQFHIFMMNVSESSTY